MRGFFLLKVVGMGWLAAGLFLSFSQSLGATKVRYVTSVRLDHYDFPLIAGQEQGIWEKHGLAVEWIQIRGDALAMKALSAGKVDAGTTNAPGGIWAAARGVPAVIIASVGQTEFLIWVRSQSAIRSPADLRGKKLAVTSLGGTVHAYAQAAINALGLEKDVKFVATGGPRESIAALRAGWVDAVATTPRSIIKLKLSGEAREIVSVREYLPKAGAGIVSYVHQRLVREEPSTVRSLATGLVEALKFLRANPGWVLDKMKSEYGRTDQEAKVILEKDLVLSPDGSLSRQEVQSVIDFMLQYGMIPKGALPPLEQYFAPVFPR